MKVATSTYAELGDDLGQDGCGVVEDAMVGGCCVFACVVSISVSLFCSACKLSSKQGGDPWFTTTETQRGGFSLIGQVVHDGVLRLSPPPAADPCRHHGRVHHFHHSKQDVDAFVRQGDHSGVVLLALMPFYVRRTVGNARGI